MKIAYLISHDIKRNDGVTKKILGQTTQWEREGNEVEIYCLIANKGCSILEKSKQYESKGALKTRFTIQNNLLSDMNEFNPDIVYFRYDTWSVTLSKILNRYKVVAELNTYDLGEFFLLFKEQRTVKSFLRYIAYKYLRNNVLDKVSGIVAVTKEIANHPSNRKFNKPMVFIPNGIDLDKYKVIKQQNRESRIGLFFIGTPGQSWHGIDIIEKMSERLPQYDFHIVGVEGLNTNNLFWHGYLRKNEYIEVLKKCHFGIGTLALFRKDMYEACPLKVREYLAYGYPIIIGYNDTAFLDVGVPSWVKKIDTLKELNMNDISDFILENKEVVVKSQEVEQFISNKIIERKRIAFFESIIQ